MPKRIKKVRIDKKAVSIKYAKQLETGEWESIDLVSPEQPKPHFVDAMQALKEDICVINEMPNKYADNMIVSGVTFSYKDETSYKATINARKEVELSNAPVSLNSPVIALSMLTPEDEHFNFKHNLKTKLDAIRDYAEQYVDGDRDTVEQDRLPFTDGDK